MVYALYSYDDPHVLPGETCAKPPYYENQSIIKVKVWKQKKH